MTYIVIKLVLPDFIKEFALGSLHTQCPSLGQEFMSNLCPEMDFLCHKEIFLKVTTDCWTERGTRSKNKWKVRKRVAYDIMP